MADEKDEGIPDSWAGFEGDGDGDAREDLKFSFDGLDFDPAPNAAGATRDDAAAVADEVVERFVEGRSPADDPLETEAVADDDIADWLEEPAVKTNHFAMTDAADTEADPEGGNADLEELVAEIEGDEVDLEPAAVLAIGASTASAAASRPPAKRTSAAGVLGPILGGLLSVPVVLLILLGILWGTGRDLIGMRSWAPSFMLPMRQEEVALAVAAASQPSPAFPEVAESDAASEEPPVEPATPDPQTPSSPTPEIAAEPVQLAGGPESPAIESPAIDTPPLAAASLTEPAVAPPPAPPQAKPLDLSGIDTAVDTALASMGRLQELATALPTERRQALVAWYKDLARVGSELAVLESAANDSGHPLDETPAAIAALYERLGSAAELAPDLKRLCRNWVDYAKRPADGVLLVGMLEAARQVGPFWYTTLALEQVDGSSRTVSLISRREPRAEPGDRVAVAGVVFSAETVWAADCGQLAGTATVKDDPF